MNTQDHLNYSKNSTVRGLMEAGEKIIFSSDMKKVNVRNKTQGRNILITNKNIYNFREEGLITSALNLFDKNAQIKRKLSLGLIDGIIYSTIGNEFVLYVPSEFDYRFMDDRRDSILSQLLYALSMCGKKSIPFYLSTELELHQFTTHNSLKKSNIINQPPLEEVKMMGLKEFNSFVKDRIREQTQTDINTDMVLSEGIKKVTLSDYSLIRTLGKGGFGKVYLAQEKATKTMYALKTIKKMFVIEKGWLDQVMREKEILFQAQHPFLVGMKCAFQTPDKLFLVMPFVRGGDLYARFRKKKLLSEVEVRFYAAQISEGLGFLHERGIVYQDMKPENVLIDSRGYAKLADFGAAKFAFQTKNCKKFIGTPAYIAPEVIRRENYNSNVDWWSLGIMMYELLFGKAPFTTKEQQKTFKKIVFEDPVFPEHIPVSEECKSVILRFLDKNPKSRLGAQGDFMEVREHPFFKDIDYNKLLNYELPAPFVPNLDSDEDVSYFDERYTTQRPKITVLSPEMVSHFKNYDHMFEGFYHDEKLAKDDWKVIEIEEKPDQEEQFQNPKP